MTQDIWEEDLEPYKFDRATLSSYKDKVKWVLPTLCLVPLSFLLLALKLESTPLIYLALGILFLLAGYSVYYGSKITVNCNRCGNEMLRIHFKRRDLRHSGTGTAYLCESCNTKIIVKYPERLDHPSA